MSKIYPVKCSRRDCGFYDCIVRALANSKYDFCPTFRKATAFSQTSHPDDPTSVHNAFGKFLVSSVTDAY